MQTEIISPATAGFRMLMILSQVDGQVTKEEKEVIRKYISEKFPAQELPTEDIDIKNIREDDFLISAMEFYQSATEKERTEFLQFAFDLIKADSKITKEENQYINLLYDAWQLDDAT